MIFEKRDELGATMPHRPTLLRRRWAVAALSMVSALTLTAAGASAQDGQYATGLSSVTEQPHEDRDPPGITAGGFDFSPFGEVQGLYDSNIYAKPDHARSDFVGLLTPGLDVQSDWSRNALGLKVQGERREYASHSSEDVTNVTAQLNGRYDIANEIYLLGGGGYELLHEDRGSPNAVDGKTPTQYTVTSGNAGFVFSPLRLGFRLDGSVDSYAFNNVESFGNGPVINESARDRVVYALTPRVSYQVTPQYNAFLRAVVNRRQYDDTRQPDGLDRSSTGYQVDLGTSLELSQLLTGEMYVGYLRQNYDSSLAETKGVVDFGANLLWTLTPMTSVRLNIARTFEESTLFDSAGYLQTTVRLTLEHELIRNVVLTGSLGYVNADFQNIPGSSNFYELSVGGRYYLNRNLYVGLDYDLRHRSAIEFLPDYTRQIIALRLHGQL